MLSPTETILNKDEGFVHVAVDLAQKVFQVAIKILHLANLLRQRNDTDRHHKKMTI